MAPAPERTSTGPRPTPSQVAAALELLATYVRHDTDVAPFELRQQMPAPTPIRADNGRALLVLVPDPTEPAGRTDGQDCLAWELHTADDNPTTVALGVITRSRQVAAHWTRKGNEAAIESLVADAAAPVLSADLFEQYVTASHSYAAVAARNEASQLIGSLTRAIPNVSAAELRTAADAFPHPDQRTVAHRILDTGFTGTADELLTATTHATT